jgi:hypothetical protein
MSTGVKHCFVSVTQLHQRTPAAPAAAQQSNPTRAQHAPDSAWLPSRVTRLRTPHAGRPARVGRRPARASSGSRSGNPTTLEGGGRTLVSGSPAAQPRYAPGRLRRPGGQFRYAGYCLNGRLRYAAMRLCQKRNTGAEGGRGHWVPVTSKIPFWLQVCSISPPVHCYNCLGAVC